jgi:cyanophycin synthetase
MIQNILPAVLAAYLRGVTIEDIKLALQTFNPSPAQTPGRLNLFQFKNFQVLLDYAHNPAGMRALQKFIQKIDCTVKIGIIAGVGDRKVEDTMQIGSIAAEMFDEIIIRQDKNLRGRSEKELIDMLTNGINQYDPNKKTTVIPNEKEATTYAIKNAKQGSLIVICSDVVTEVLALIQKMQEEEAQ